MENILIISGYFYFVISNIVVFIGWKGECGVVFCWVVDVDELVCYDDLIIVYKCGVCIDLNCF